MAQYDGRIIKSDSVHTIDLVIPKNLTMRMHEIREFCEDDFRSGSYAFLMKVDRRRRGDEFRHVRYCFTSPDVAFEFKMRFG